MKDKGVRWPVNKDDIGAMDGYVTRMHAGRPGVPDNHPQMPIVPTELVQAGGEKTKLVGLTGAMASVHEVDPDACHSDVTGGQLKEELKDKIKFRGWEGITDKTKRTGDYDPTKPFTQESTGGK